MLGLRHWGFGFWSRSAIKTLLVTACLFYAHNARASVAVLVGEPFGNFGTMMPVGHTAIYLDHLCADGPLKLRACRPGEPEGVVVARYHQLGQYDWLASPVMEFLYATDDPAKVLSYANLDNSWDLREIYRRRYLEEDRARRHRVRQSHQRVVGVRRHRLHAPHLGLPARHHAGAGPPLHEHHERAGEPSTRTA